jgi:hypothetical protein
MGAQAMSGGPTDPESDSAAAAILAIIRPIPTPKYCNEYLPLDTRSTYLKRSICNRRD